MKPKLQVLDQSIATTTKDGVEYINITGIEKYKNTGRSDDLIRNSLRNRNTIEFLDIWEQLNNSNFKPVEFDGFEKQAGLNSFTLTPKQWTLVCLANMESLNAHFIERGISQPKRLEQLNDLAIRQMNVLVQNAVSKQLKIEE